MLAVADPRTSELEIFSGEFPLTLQFRGNPLPAGTTDLAVIAQRLNVYSGRTDKFLREELERTDDYVLPYRAWKEANPQKLLLVHLNGEARAVRYPEVHQRYFPGHWVYYPGATLLQAIEAHDTELQVGDVSNFANRKFGGTVADGSPRLPDVLIVQLDAQGRRLWSESEYAVVKAVNAARGTLTVDRGQYRSTARAFEAHTTYIAPLVSGFWGGNMMWFYNLSALCPTDANGRTAADHFLEEIADWFSPQGPLRNFDGIGFDVNYFKAKWPGFDVDNDGVSDDGIAPDGHNFWREGDWAFLKRLRAVLGEDRLITGDSWMEAMQMAPGILNGMESEGLVAPADGWRRLAQTINTQSYWRENNPGRRQFSYITAKLNQKDDAKHAVSLRRLGAATACCLGVAYTDGGLYQRADGINLLPELTLGTLQAARWLGRPLGEAKILTGSGEDLWAGAGIRLDQAFKAKLVVRNGRINASPDGELSISGTAGSPHAEIVLELPAIGVTTGEVILTFEAQAQEPLAGFRNTDFVPRQIMVSASGLPAQSSTPPINGDTLALMGTHRFTRQYAYFRRAGNGTGKLVVYLCVEGNGSFVLRNLIAHHGSLGLAREFEHGLVLANAAEQPLTFDLQTVMHSFPSGTLRRIALTPAMFSTPTTPAVQEMLAWNDGSPITQPQVTVPGLNGLFLIKSP